MHRGVGAEMIQVAAQRNRNALPNWNSMQDSNAGSNTNFPNYPWKVLQSRLDAELSRLQEHALQHWKGRETEAILTICERLDALMGLLWFAPDFASDNHLRVVAASAASVAMSPFLHAVTSCEQSLECPDPSERDKRYAERYLLDCGHLLQIRRKSEFERAGVAKTSQHGDSFLVEMIVGGAEGGYLDVADTIAMQEAFRQISETRAASDGVRALTLALASKSGNKPTEDPHAEIRDHFLSLARSFRGMHPEPESISRSRLIFGAKFSEWLDFSERALADCLSDYVQHSWLQIQRRGVRFVSAKRLQQLWADTAIADRIIPSMCLTSEQLIEARKTYNSPAFSYIKFGNDKYLCPAFGLIANPYYRVVQELQRNDQKTWNDETSRSYLEDRFRIDLPSAFPPSRFYIHPHSIPLKNAENPNELDGDIDALVVDRWSGDAAIIELKFFKPFSRSPSQYLNARSAVLRAQDQVNRVRAWMDSCDTDKFFAKYQVDCSVKIRLPLVYIVLCRYNASFSGATEQDGSFLIWISWAELCYSLRQWVYAPNPLRNLRMIRGRNYPLPPLSPPEQTLLSDGSRITVRPRYS